MKNIITYLLARRLIPWSKSYVTYLLAHFKCPSVLCAQLHKSQKLIVNFLAINRPTLSVLALKFYLRKAFEVLQFYLVCKLS